MTNEIGILSNIRCYRGNKDVAVENDASLEISCIDNAFIPLSIGSNLKLKHILIVPPI